MKEINLQDFRTLGSKVFTGRDRGIEVREKSNIDQIADSYSEIYIEIPVDIRSINPSFLEEFLFNVVTKLGESGFRKKFKFINKGRYQIQNDLDEAIERILRDENALV